MAELSDKQLKIGIWWLNHRHQLKKWWVILIAVLDILVFLYILFNVVIIIFTWNRFTGIPNQISQSVINFQYYQQINAPKDIQVLSTKYISVPGQLNKYHLLARLKNPNSKWTMNQLDYHFRFGNKDQDQQFSFMLPQEERYVIQYYVENIVAQPNIQLFIDNVNWKRIEQPEEAPNSNFSISNINTSLIPLLDEKGSPTATFSTRVTAEIQNQSVYNFWEVGFQIILYRGEEPIAAAEISINQFLAQTTRDLTFSWKEAYYGVTKTEILPEVNVHDPETLFKQEASGTAPL